MGVLPLLALIILLIIYLAVDLKFLLLAAHGLTFELLDAHLDQEVALAYGGLHDFQWFCSMVPLKKDAIHLFNNLLIILLFLLLNLSALGLQIFGLQGSMQTKHSLCLELTLNKRSAFLLFALYLYWRYYVRCVIVFGWLHEGVGSFFFLLDGCGSHRYFYLLRMKVNKN